MHQTITMKRPGLSNSMEYFARSRFVCVFKLTKKYLFQFDSGVCFGKAVYIIAQLVGIIL